MLSGRLNTMMFGFLYYLLWISWMFSSIIASACLEASSIVCFAVCFAVWSLVPSISFRMIPVFYPSYFVAHSVGRHGTSLVSLTYSNYGWGVRLCRLVDRCDLIVTALPHTRRGPPAGKSEAYHSICITIHLSLHRSINIISLYISLHISPSIYQSIYLSMYIYRYIYHYPYITPSRPQYHITTYITQHSITLFINLYTVPLSI